MPRRERGSYRRVPSPLHGTSQRMRSNRRYLSSSDAGMVSPVVVVVVVVSRCCAKEFALHTLREGSSIRLWDQLDEGESLSGRIGHQETWAVHLRQLVSQHVAPFFVDIVRKHDTPYVYLCKTTQHNTTHYTTPHYTTILAYLAKRRQKLLDEGSR